MTYKCKLCGGDHVRAHRLREGERIEEGNFVADSHSSAHQRTCLNQLRAICYMLKYCHTIRNSGMMAKK